MRRSALIVVLLTILVVGATLGPRAAIAQSLILQGAAPGQPTPNSALLPRLLLPLLRGRPPTYTIRGAISDGYARPLAGVTVVDQYGHTATTDGMGRYAIPGLPAGAYTVAPQAAGYNFAPAARTVNLYGPVQPQDFTGLAACSEAIVNGGFELDNGWVFPAGDAVPAVYSTDVAHSGARSVRTGIPSGGADTYSYSSAYQQITLPAVVQSVTLRLWLYQLTAEAGNLPLPNQPSGADSVQGPNAYDAQYVLILDQNNNLMATLLWTRSNTAQWTFQQFDLAAYAGQTIRISVGTYNDGTGGVTSMYVDDASLEVCTANGATATPLPTATNTPPPPGVTPPTPTQAIPTPTQGNPTPTTAPGGCTNQMGNSSFEFSGSWGIPITTYPAAYTTLSAHSGSQAMRTGILASAANRLSYSDAYQVVSIPSNSSATLSMWLNLSSSEATNAPDEQLPALGEVGKPWGELPATGEAPAAADRQYVLVLDRSGNLIEFLYSKRINTQIWKEVRFDLSRYAGQTIRIQFGTYNDGFGGITSMLVDDVVLDTCASAVTPTPAPQVTSTPVPGTCYEAVSNTGFEADTGWTIPVTAFSAGYSTAQAHSGSRSMRTGIVFQAHNRFSYSDFRQTISIPSGARSVSASFWLYPVSSEAANLAVPEKPAGQVFGANAPARDVQYVLVLDRFGNWIDTLVWQRSNAQAWTQVQLNLVRYAGMTISLQFGTYNDGAGGVTAMYVDDVGVQVCP